MTTFYSTSYSPDGVNQTSATNPRNLAEAAVDGGRVCYKRCYLDQTDEANIIGDEFHFFRVRSGDSIVRLLFSERGNFATGATLDIGYYETGVGDVGGDVVDSTIHASALALDSGNTQLDIFNESTNINDEDRGLPIWKLLNAAGASFSEDPLTEWHLTGIYGSMNGSNGSDILIEMYYLPALG